MAVLDILVVIEPRRREDREGKREERGRSLASIPQPEGWGYTNEARLRGLMGEGAIA